jgi:hypothetical protein
MNPVGPPSQAVMDLPSAPGSVKSHTRQQAVLRATRPPEPGSAKYKIAAHCATYAGTDGRSSASAGALGRQALGGSGFALRARMPPIISPMPMAG